MSKLNKILSRVLEKDEKDITDNSSPDTIETWDSFNGLMLVSELENEFNVSFTTNEVVSVKNVSDIKKILIKHGIKLDDK